MQSGRGGGLTESFASAESMFGAKTNQFMVRLTVTVACVFLVASLSLARLSAIKERSLISDKIIVEATDNGFPEVPAAVEAEAVKAEAKAE